MNKIPYNIQFFADGEGEEGSETAEQTTETTETAEVNETGKAENADAEPDGETNPEPPEPKVDENAKYAAARRQAEAEIKKRDEEIARRFSNYKNPITGKAITSEKDYFEALDAQQTLDRNEKLQEQGIDPQIIEDAVTNHPLMKQANEILLETQKQHAMDALNKDFEEVQKINPDLKNIDQIENLDKVMELITDNKLSLVDAYKIANYDILAGKKVAAVKQAAINQAKGKEHLTTTDGVATGEGLVDIPENLRSRWEEWFSDKTPAQRKALYNQTLHR